MHVTIYAYIMSYENILHMYGIYRKYMIYDIWYDIWLYIQNIYIYTWYIYIYT